MQKEMATYSSIRAWSHGQMSLLGCGPWHCKESDTTERLNHHHQELQTQPTGLFGLEADNDRLALNIKDLGKIKFPK